MGLMDANGRMESVDAKWAVFIYIFFETTAAGKKKPQPPEQKPQGQPVKIQGVVFGRLMYGGIWGGNVFGVKG